MSKLEERENRKKSLVVGSIVDNTPAAASGKMGRPYENIISKSFR